jgi:hypothetical protein
MASLLADGPFVRFLVPDLRRDLTTVFSEVI